MVRSFTVGQAPWLSWHPVGRGCKLFFCLVSNDRDLGVGRVLCVVFFFLGRKYFILNISSFDVLSIKVRSNVQRSFWPWGKGGIWGYFHDLPKQRRKASPVWLIACWRSFLWEQWHANSVGTHPFPHLIANAPCSVDFNVRVVRYFFIIYNFNTEVLEVLGISSLTLFLSSLSSYSVHEIINVVWISV